MKWVGESRGRFICENRWKCGRPTGKLKEGTNSEATDPYPTKINNKKRCVLDLDQVESMEWEDGRMGQNNLEE